MMNIFAESAHVRDYVIDLLVAQQIPKRRHNLREPTRWPAMHYHGLPIAVRLRRGPGAVREIRKRVGPLEHCVRFGSTLPLDSVTRNASAFVDLLPILHIGGLRIVERLRGKQ